MRTVALAVGCALLAGGFAYGPAQASDQSLAMSAAAKKSHAKRYVVRRRPAQHVACTVFGCHPVPPGCVPQQSYDWRGIPTGFDVAVCR